MKKTFFYCSIFVFVTSFLSAQSTCSISLQAGMANSHYVRPGGLKDAAERLPFYGLNVGASLRHNFTAKFYWQAGLQYAQLGARIVTADLKWASEVSTGSNGDLIYTRDPSLAHRLTWEQRTKYLSLRAGLGYYLLSSEKLRLGLMPFAEANMLLANKNEQGLYFDDGSLDHIGPLSEGEEEASLRNLNISTGFAFSLEANITEKFALILSPEATYQLLPAPVRSQINDDTRRYFAVGLSLGAIYQL